ncbi:peptidase S8/S53 domain-containing protein [Fennellomyces sp. T-0311]|nr:peptidase S8/S53 domain-containing protein [Fennellomyces sp. T-0311]
MKFTFLTVLSVLVFATFATAKPQNYIIQLNQTAAIDDFIPKLISDTRKFFHDLFKEAGEKFEELANRDDDDNGSNEFRIRESFSIGNSFKAIDVELMDDRVIEKIRKRFSEVINIIPDEEVQFELPRPLTEKKKKNDKRYYIRPVRNSTYAESYEADTEGWTSYISPTTTSNDETATATTTAAAGVLTEAAVEEEAEISYIEQANAQWNLVRISQRDNNSTQPYIYDSRGGAGVTVYVVDDGLAVNHEDFEGRATRGYSAFSDQSTTSSGGNSTESFGSSAQLGSDPLDGGGHGTHVAGIIGGKTYGVAKNVSLVSVQVLRGDGKGTVSSLLGGIQWIMEQEKDRKRPVVINMSLGLPESSGGAQALNEAVASAVDAGLPVIAAAGNSASNACKISPAGNRKVFAVGSTGSDDKMDPYSCYGRCVDILAPGFDITSTYIGENDATATMSGTSMAAPHVAGVAALLLPGLEEGIAPSKLYREIKKISTPRKVTDIPDWLTPNKLLFNGQEKTEE